MNGTEDECETSGASVKILTVRTDSEVVDILISTKDHAATIYSWAKISDAFSWESRECCPKLIQISGFRSTRQFYLWLLSSLGRIEFQVSIDPYHGFSSSRCHVSNSHFPEGDSSLKLAGFPWKKAKEPKKATFPIDNCPGFTRQMGLQIYIENRRSNVVPRSRCQRSLDRDGRIEMKSSMPHFSRIRAGCVGSTTSRFANCEKGVSARFDTRFPAWWALASGSNRW